MCPASTPPSWIQSSMIPYDRAFRLGMALSCLHSTKGYATIVMAFSESATSFEVQAYLSRLVVGIDLVGRYPLFSKLANGSCRQTQEYVRVRPFARDADKHCSTVLPFQKLRDFT